MPDNALKHWFKRFLVVGRRPDGEPNRGRAVAASLAISTLLWLTLSLQNSYTVAITFPLQIVNMPEDQALRVLPPDEVRAEVRGQAYRLLPLYLRPPTLSVDGSEAVINLLNNLPILSQHIRIESMVPATLVLQRDPIQRKRVPVRLRGTIRAASTHDMAGRIQLEPDSVMISGAASILSGIQTWPTEPIALVGLTDSLRQSIALSDSLRGLILLAEREVMLSAPVKPFVGISREVTIEVLGVPSYRQVVAFDPPRIAIDARVAMEEYDAALSSESFRATVALSALQADTTGFISPTLSFEGSEDVRYLRSRPNRVRYYFTLEDQP